jgi:hypothetical protein
MARYEDKVKEWAGDLYMDAKCRGWLEGERKDLILALETVRDSLGDDPHGRKLRRFIEDELRAHGLKV